MDGVTRTSGSIPLPGGERATAQVFSGPFDRVRACDRVLAALIEAGTLLTVTTGLRTTESLGLTRYKAERSSQHGDAVKVVLEFKRVRVASTRRVAVPAVRRAQVQVDRGAQPVDNRSALAMGLDGGAPATAARSAARSAARARGGGS